MDANGPAVAAGPQPAYPGGPLPGEAGEGDDRYEAHEASNVS